MSPSCSPGWIRARVRRTGITEWRPGGQGSLLAEPVLVCVSGPWYRSWYPQEIYDQHGNLLAFTKRQQSGGRLQKLLRSGSRVDLFDLRGQIQLSSCMDRTWNPCLLTTTGPDGSEIGTVTTSGKRRGLILADGATVGRLEFPPGLVNKVLRRGGYTLYDADGIEVGHIRFSMTALKHCRVIDVDHRASETLRANLFAAAAAVNYWEQSSAA